MASIFRSVLSFVLCLAFTAGTAQKKADPETLFRQPPAAARPWTFWYWMHGAVSKAGITLDLEAMKRIGLEGAYLMPIQDTTAAIPFQPAVRQLTPAWWEMVRFAMQECKRLNLKLAMHVSDGFALAGGPWIKPEQSMQKIVWKMVQVSGGQSARFAVPQPEAYPGYYRDIAVYAFPAPAGAAHSSATLAPEVSTSLGIDAAFLATDSSSKTFSSNDSCWIQYRFAAPFTCRSILIRKPGTSFQSQRLLLQVSNDGIRFQDAEQLEPARHGWQDGDVGNTYSIRPVTATYFRFVYRKTGTEPGSEDLDAAKWKPSLKINGITLLSEARIHQYEAKNGTVWRVAAPTTTRQLADAHCIPRNRMLNLTGRLQPDGTLNWQVPAGNWTILRMGHTSTGHTNATGGAGQGLECDKFNPDAVTLQFRSWFGAAFTQTDPALARAVLKVFHVDSWEAGSQNWSPLFRREFMQRRGYDPLPWLPCVAGIPLETAAASEKFLHDLRQTIAELVNDVFYKTLARLAHEKGCTFTAESVAPTMTSDGLLHYQTADVPMGEFWLNSPTHDKPNDMLDAVSGAHIYGKNIVQAEGFTTVRMAWNEHPGMLKTVQDRNYALGVNRLVYHVFAHNPFTNRKPGVTLDGVGLYFQRDQTWWKPGRAWIDYATRCQALLQMGNPVTDIAVFTGEELPRRSVLPDRLVPVLPGIVGKRRVASEARRLANTGQPLQTIPDGVNSSANMFRAADWIDPLRGYQYDCVNPDVLRRATVSQGRIRLPGGASYGLLVLPGQTKMDPGGGVLSATMRKELQRLLDAGARLIAPPDMKLAGRTPAKASQVAAVPYEAPSFAGMGIEKDLLATDAAGNPVDAVAWTHRTGPGYDLYFVANQDSTNRSLTFSLRVKGAVPRLFDPVSGSIYPAEWKTASGRTFVKLELQPEQSMFIVLEQGRKKTGQPAATVPFATRVLNNPWQVQFDTAYGGPAEPVTETVLQDWSRSEDPAIRYYSGTATYTTSFRLEATAPKAVLHLGELANLATVKVNGTDCGTVWTFPYQVDVSRAVRPGENRIEVAVTNTWHNRLIGDHLLPESRRRYWTTAPFRLEGKPLDKAGLIGPVQLFLYR